MSTCAGRHPYNLEVDRTAGFVGMIIEITYRKTVQVGVEKKNDTIKMTNCDASCFKVVSETQFQV